MRAFFLLLLFAHTLFAQNIRIEGRRNANLLDPWATIDDGGNNPPLASQDATRFGNVTLGETRDERFRINNTDGNTPLVVEDVRSQISQYTFPDLPGGGSTSFTVPAGGEREFIIRFRPTSFSLTGPIIQVRSNSTGNNETFYTFRVSGTGVGPNMRVFGGSSFSQEILDGDTTPRGADGTLMGSLNLDANDFLEQDFQIRNIEGNRALNLSNPRFVGTDANDFSVSGLNTAFNIGDGNTRDFTIRYDPSRPGTGNATLLIDTDDERQGRRTFSFAVRATSTGTPTLSMEGRSFGGLATYRDIVDGTTSTSGNNGTDAGVIELGETARFRLRATNDGTASLTLFNVALSNSNFAPLSAPGLIAPGGSEEFSITATPTAAGLFETNVTLTGENFTANPYTFRLRVEVMDSSEEMEIRGPDDTTVISSGSAAPNTSNGTDFGVIRRSATEERAQEFTIFNVGTSPLSISNPRFLGEGAAAFSIRSLSTATNIGAGGSRSFEIVFEPDSDGEFLADFLIDSSDTDRDPYRFAVKGVAAESPVLVVEAIDSDTGEWVALADNADPSRTLGTAFLGFPWNEFRESPLRLRNAGFGEMELVVDSSAQLFLAGVPPRIPQGGVVEVRLRAEPSSPLPSGLEEQILLSSDENVFDAFRLNARIFATTLPSLKLVSPLRPLDPLEDGQSQVSLEEGTVILDDPNQPSPSRNFELSSRFGEDFNITAISLTGPAASSFSISGTPPSPANPINLNANNSYTLAVFFNAPDFTRQEVFVRIETDLPGNASDFVFRLEGRGQINGAIPKIEIIANGQPLPSNASTNVPTGNHYGALRANGLPESLSFEIRNAGEGSLLDITEVGFGPLNESVMVSDFPDTLLSGESASFTVTLQPGSETGTGFFQFRITTNDPETGVYLLPLAYFIRPQGSPEIEITGTRYGVNGTLTLDLLARRDVAMVLQASKTLEPGSWVTLGPVFAGRNFFSQAGDPNQFPKRFFQVVEGPAN